MIKMVVATVRKLVVMIAIMGETTVLREGPMVLLEANEVVLLCHEIQIIMPHRILIMGRLGISDQRRLLDQLVNFSSDDSSSGHEKPRSYHNLEGHMQDLDLTSGQYYGMRYGYGQMPQLKRSASTSQISTSTEY